MDLQIQNKVISELPKDVSTNKIKENLNKVKTFIQNIDTEGNIYFSEKKELALQNIEKAIKKAEDSTLSSDEMKKEVSENFAKAIKGFKEKNLSHPTRKAINTLLDELGIEKKQITIGTFRGHEFKYPLDVNHYISRVAKRSVQDILNEPGSLEKHKVDIQGGHKKTSIQKIASNNNLIQPPRGRKKTSVQKIASNNNLTQPPTPPGVIRASESMKEVLEYEEIKNRTTSIKDLHDPNILNETKSINYIKNNEDKIIEIKKEESFDKKMYKLFKTANELKKTENKLHQDMEKLNKTLKQYSNKKSAGYKNRLENFLKFHKEFNKELSNCISIDSIDTKKLKNLFNSETFKNVINSINEYVKHYNSDKEKLVGSKNKEKNSIRQKIKKKEGYDINNEILKPIQRLMRYPLLFKEMKKNTIKEENEVQKNIREIKSITKNESNTVNENEFLSFIESNLVKFKKKKIQFLKGTTGIETKKIKYFSSKSQISDDYAKELLERLNKIKNEKNEERIDNIINVLKKSKNFKKIYQSKSKIKSE